MKDFVELTIDKTDGVVCYDDKHHVYWDRKDMFTYISVTTLISMFENYDRDFWLGYKALQEILADKPGIKKFLFNLRKLKAIDIDEVLSIYPGSFTAEEFENKKKEYSDKWNESGRKACEFGTKAHARYENRFKEKDWYQLDWLGFKPTEWFAYIPGFYQFSEKLDRQVFPEMLISMKTESGVRIAGQVDLCLKNKNIIQIMDYKGLPIDTPILTVDGWKFLCNLTEEDYVYDKDGNPCKVLHKSSIHTNPCYKITFDNSEEIICDEDHKWLVFNCNNPKNIIKHTIMTAKQIDEYIKCNYNNTLKRGKYTTDSKLILKIDNPKSLNSNINDIELPIDPYILGVWLGDGSSAAGIVHNPEKDIWDELRKRWTYGIGDNVGGKDRCEARTIYNLCSKLKELNLLNNKHIPNIYYKASVKQRIELLQGLMDTDGYYHKKRKRFVMNTTKEWQVKALVSLLASLSIKPTIIPYNAHLKDRNGNKKIFEAFAITFNCPFNPFLVRNKDIKLSYTTRSKYRIIKKIEKVSTVPTCCIMVDSPSHTYLAGYSLIPTHNSNAELKFESYRDPYGKYQMMKYPLNELMDCNAIHYQLQTSIYTWILKRRYRLFDTANPKIIHLYNKENTEERKIYELEYIPSAVILMFRYFRDHIHYNYKKVIEHEGRFFIARDA